MLKYIKVLILFLVAMQIQIFSQSHIEFSSETINNNTITFSEVLENGPVLVNFWALWCKPCRAEMKHLESLYQKYKEKGFTIIGINQDTPRSLAKVKSYVSTHKLSFPILTDPNQEIFQRFNGQSIPLSFLYNKSGEITYEHVGYLPGDEIELEEEIKSVLGM